MKPAILSIPTLQSARRAALAGVRCFPDVGNAAFGFEFWRTAASAMLLALGSACAAITPMNAALEAARSDYLSAEATETVFLFAGRELEDAGDALNTARKAWLRRASKAEVDNYSFVVVQRLVVARRVAAGRVDEMQKQGSAMENER